MRRIVMHLGISLDGYFEGPDADISWHRVDEELHTFFNRQLATCSAFLEGRVTYQLMEEYWPTADPTLVQDASREQRLEAYRDVRDGLTRRIKARLKAER